MEDLEESGLQFATAEEIIAEKFFLYTEA